MLSEMFVGQFTDRLVIRVLGHGTMRESLAFRAVADSLHECGEIVFDASWCEYLDSTFLGCLIGLNKACEQTPGRRFVIAASPPRRVKLFATSSLDKYFSFVEPTGEPLDDFERVTIDCPDPRALGQHSMESHHELAERGGPEAAAFKAVAERLSKDIESQGTKK